MIPLSTTTITVARVVLSGTEDAYDANAPAPTQVASGVRAVISPPQASVQLSGGDRVVYTAPIRCDPVDLQPGDQVTDASGTVWICLWATAQSALGMSFTLGELRLVTGVT